MSDEKPVASLLEKEFYACLDVPNDISKMRRFFLLLLRVHYSDPKNYVEPFNKDLERLTYTDDPTGDGLRIELANTFDPDKRQSNPAIYITFAPFQFSKQVTANRQEDNQHGDGSSLTIRSASILNIAHLCMSADQALVLAQNTAFFLFAISEAIRGVLSLNKFDPNVISDVQVAGALPERQYRVDASFTLEHNMLVKFNVESHRIKKIISSLDAALP